MITGSDLLDAYLPIEDDPIAKHLDEQDRYWREQGGRDPGPTYQQGAKERIETGERPR